MTKPTPFRLGLAALAALALAGCSTTGDSGQPLVTDYAAVLADAKRPEADRARDAARKPGELLAFAQIRTGQRVGDFVMGGGYLTRILAQAVGSGGTIEAFQPDEFIAFRKQYAADQATVAGAYPNVLAVNGSIAAPRFTAPLDTIVTVQNFHDMYLKPFPADTGARGSAALFAALKPGGVLVVVDHAAVAGSGTTLSDSLHRIDRQAVIDALTKVGFKLEAESQLYADPSDPRSANVFNPAIRGKTDQFVLRFRKPGK